MEYGKIISVTGLGGLFELVGSKKDGAIVRSLEDKTTRFVASRVHNFSHLESIEVYTERDNANLVEVFVAMKSSAEPLPSEKDGDAVKAYFQKVFPAMDFERVYASDMKKMVRWFSVLANNDIEFKLSEELEPEADADVAPALVVDVVKEDAPEANTDEPKKKASRNKNSEEKEAE